MEIIAPVLCVFHSVINALGSDTCSSALHYERILAGGVNNRDRDLLSSAGPDGIFRCGTMRHTTLFIWNMNFLPYAFYPICAV